MYHENAYLPQTLTREIVILALQCWKRSGDCVKSSQNVSYIDTSELAYMNWTGSDPKIWSDQPFAIQFNLLKIIRTSPNLKVEKWT